MISDVPLASVARRLSFISIPSVHGTYGRILLFEAMIPNYTLSRMYFIPKSHVLDSANTASFLIFHGSFMLSNRSSRGKPRRK